MIETSRFLMVEYYNVVSVRELSVGETGVSIARLQKISNDLFDRFTF